MSRRASFSSAHPDLYFPPSTHSPSHHNTPILKLWIFKFHNTATFFRRIRAKLIAPLTTRHHNVSSSATLVRSHSYSYAETTLDSQRAEAIEDCIHFFNSSSMQRSSSVATSC